MRRMLAVLLLSLASSCQSHPSVPVDFAVKAVKDTGDHAVAKIKELTISNSLACTKAQFDAGTQVIDSILAGIRSLDDGDSINVGEFRNRLGRVRRAIIASKEKRLAEIPIELGGAK